MYPHSYQAFLPFSCITRTGSRCVDRPKDLKSSSCSEVTRSSPPSPMPRITCSPSLRDPFFLLLVVVTMLHWRSLFVAAHGAVGRSGAFLVPTAFGGSSSRSSMRGRLIPPYRLMSTTLPNPSVSDPKSVPTPPSSSIPDYNHRDALTSRDGLPLVYEPKTIKKYWDARPAEMQRRWALFLSVTAPFLTKLVKGFTQGTLFDKEAELARDLRIVLEKLGPTFVKLGQALSIRPDVIGPAATEELQKLQDAESSGARGR
ncbi:hypothetical protein Naga_101194g1 [Nannochloropsis gaditana]|uniref:ABC1 atypical kinase-like domain-containing protein n=1 Tax=Nannochloropsis gaditana TaxID=72520 RepID=W7TP01_9STRA|nr:hypothetical protein Naga_101194g1 [Nannochloropsis gaditana]